MQINKAEQLLAMQLLTNVMQQSTNKSNPAFAIALEAVMKNFIDNKEINQKDTSSVATNDAKTNNLNNKIYKTNYLKINFKKSKIDNEINSISKKFGVNSNLVKAIIKQESDFDPKAVSGAGAMGLMQLMPENCREDGVKNPFDISENIKGGVKQIKRYLEKYNGNIPLTLMAYNAGEGTVARRGVSSLNDLYKMPYETRNYVNKIMGSLGML